MKATSFLFCSVLCVLGVSAPAHAQFSAPAASPAAPGVSNAPLPAAPENLINYGDEQLLADLKRDLTDRYHLNGDLQLELVRPWATLEKIAGPVILTVTEAPSNLAPSILLRIRAQSPEKVLFENTIVLRAQLLREVWVARNPIDRGEAFDPAALDTRRVDTLRERDTLAVNEPVSDLTFSHPITSGRVLTWRDVAKRSLVRKGEVIQVSAVDGLLTINLKALAMEDGTAGDTVRVRNLESKKEFFAQVTGDAHAQIRL